MKKYLFLDVDGVIAVPSCMPKYNSWGLCDEKQELLGYILQKTGAKIVLISSWRLHDLESTKEYMSDKGFKFVDEIIGVTIRAYHYIQKEYMDFITIPRGVEVQHWIHNNIYNNSDSSFISKTPFVDFNYVILDDDTDFLMDQTEHFINTDFEEGLTKEKADLCISILNRVKNE